MPQKTDLNVSPYFDDFDESDNFARTLFRPGFAVQAREVTQLQTILQKQIERHGSHIFQDGSIVLGCVPAGTCTFIIESVNVFSCISQPFIA